MHSTGSTDNGHVTTVPWEVTLTLLVHGQIWPLPAAGSHLCLGHVKREELGHARLVIDAGNRTECLQPCWEKRE